MDLAELIRLVQNNQQLVIHARQCMQENGQSFTRRARLVRVEKEADNIRTIRKPAHHASKIITTVHGIGVALLQHARKVGRCVNHTGRIHHDKVAVNA